MADQTDKNSMDAAEQERQRLLIKSREELVSKTKEAFKVFAPMSTFLGFVGDIIKPLAPVLHYVAAFFGVGALVLVAMVAIGRRTGKIFKITSYLPHSVILFAILTFFSLIGYGSKDGFFGTNLDIVHKFQVSVLNVEPTPPAEEPGDEKQDAPVADIDVSVIDQHLDGIRELISLQKLLQQPSEVSDFLVNGGIYYNVGNFAMAEKMFEQAFTSGYSKLDLCSRYYEVLFANMEGDEQAITRRLDSLDLSANEMMKVAIIDFHYSGVAYYQHLERAGLKDPMLRALAQNMKARSLINDSHNYWQYQPYLVARWIPRWNANDKTLGKNIIRAKKYFFDYPAAYRKYHAGTTAEDREDLVWRTDIHNASNDPYVQRDADFIWQRVVSGASAKAAVVLDLSVSGVVSDETGQPMADVVVTDLDTHRSGSTEYNMTVSDSAGRFSLTTGRNHLLRFEPMFNKAEFRDGFIVTGTADAARVTIRKKQ